MFNFFLFSFQFLYFECKLKLNYENCLNNINKVTKLINISLLTAHRTVAVLRTAMKNNEVLIKAI